MLGVSSAQTKAAFIRAGEEAIAKHDYFSAMNYFEEALAFPGSEAEIRYQYGEAARQFFAYDLAVQQYQLVLNDKKADRFPLTKFWLSTAYQSMGQYQKAINGFKDFIKNTRNEAFKNKAILAQEECEWALSLVNQPHNIEITHLAKKINTPYSEFGAVRHGDTLYYSSYRYKMTKDQSIPPRRMTKVLYQMGTARGRPLTRKFNETDKLTAHTSLTPNGQRIYYTICEYSGKVDIRCQIYFREQDKRKRWGAAQKLPAAVNMEGYTATQPTWGLDPTTQKEVLYFTSDRPEGKGGLDIYQVEITKNGFGDPVNLSAINTEKDDITPFYHQKSQSLFFSSQGYQSLGGYDIYQANHNGNEWERPQHTGYPLNSSYNDIYFTLNADSTQAYISSNRTGSFYLEEKNKACCNDIFAVKINLPLPKDPTVPEKDSTVLVVTPPTPPVPPVIPVVVDTTPIVAVVPPPPVKPVVEPPIIPTEVPVEPPKVIAPPPIATTVAKLSTMLPLPLYFHNDQPDTRSFLETTNTNYETTYNDYVQRRDEYLDAVLPLERSAVTNFFDQDIENGYRNFLAFCNGVLGQLEQGKNVSLTLRGFTSPRAQSGYNLALGKRRTASIVNFFRNHQGGVFLQYLNRGQLEIQEISFGESKAPSVVSDQLQDPRNSIYIPAAARERRVELVEIQVE